MEKGFLRQNQGRSIIPCEEAPVRPHALRHVIEDGMCGENDIDTLGSFVSTAAGSESHTSKRIFLKIGFCIEVRKFPPLRAHG